MFTSTKPPRGLLKALPKFLFQFLILPLAMVSVGSAFNVNSILPLSTPQGLGLDDVTQVDQLTDPSLLPSDLDHLLYEGASDFAGLYNSEGEPDVSSNAVDQLTYVILLAKILDVPVYIKGHVGFKNLSARLYSNNHLYGDPSSPGVVHFMKPGGTIGFHIKNGSTNVRIENLTFNEVEDLRIAMVHLGGDNENIVINGNVFTGANVEAEDVICTGVLMTSGLVKNIHILDNHFTGLQYCVHCTCPAQNLNINRNNFRQWNHYAIRVGRGGNQLAHRSEAINIVQNDFRDVAVGPIRGVVLVTRGESLMFVHNVAVNGNLIVANGGAFVSGEENSSATGDQIVLHGAYGFSISSNRIYHGGENGITASRLSRNGIISDNSVYATDGHGIDIGSGYYEMAISHPQNFSVGDEILGAVSGTRANISSIEIHPADGRWILGVDRARGGSVFTDETIHNVTQTGLLGYSSVVDRTKNIRILGNRVWGNGLDQAGDTPFTYGIFIVNSDSISMRRNKIFNPNYAEDLAAGEIQDQRFSIRLANSRNIYISEDNIFEKGAQTPAQATSKTRSSWLSESDVATGF